MSKPGRGARSPRPNVEGSSPPGRGGAPSLLARLLDSPGLARAVPQLPPDVLYRVIERFGLEDCADLVALATPGQLSAVFDLDLWRSARPGMDEAFDPARFLVWLELLAEAGASFAARRLAEIDVAVVTAAFERYVAVYDLAAVPSLEIDGEIQADGLRDGLHCEVGGYLVVARQTEAWDTIVDVLIALDAERPERFHYLMSACRRLSNSRPEVDGLDDLLTDSEQARFDLDVDRERRREEQAYVTPAQARAFLQWSRQLRLGADGAPVANPTAVAYFRSIGPTPPVADPGAQSGSTPAASESTGSANATAVSDESRTDVAAIVSVLREAGVVDEWPRALLGPADARTPRLALVQGQMQFVHARDAAAGAARAQELAFLANVLLAGCSLQGRSFTTREASDAAVAVCNLGLENWPATPALPEDFLVGHGLASAFQIGWAVLHERVCLLVAERLLGTLDGFRCGDRRIQAEVDDLRRKLTTQWEAGTPWAARDALAVIAMLDMPAWAALTGLMGECPVMLANVGASGSSRPLAISLSAFDLISENTQIASVHEFMGSLADTLSR